MPRHDKIILYHGSSAIIERPEFGVGRKTNDYGLGFYLTESPQLAGEWAVLYTGIDGYINEYELYLDGMDILDTDDVQLENLIAVFINNRDINFIEDFADSAIFEILEAFVNKYNIDVNRYDLIRGIRANDRFYSYMRGFITGVLSIESIAGFITLGDWGTQWCLKSEKAFGALNFIKWTAAESSLYYKSAQDRNKNAGELYRKNRKSASGGKYIKDFVNGENS